VVAARAELLDVGRGERLVVLLAPIAAAAAVTSPSCWRCSARHVACSRPLDASTPRGTTRGGERLGVRCRRAAAGADARLVVKQLVLAELHEVAVVAELASLHVGHVAEEHEEHEHERLAGGGGSGWRRARGGRRSRRRRW
jgi:hypothetical protein